MKNWQSENLYPHARKGEREKGRRVTCSRAKSAAILPIHLACLLASLKGSQTYQAKLLHLFGWFHGTTVNSTDVNYLLK